MDGTSNQSLFGDIHSPMDAQRLLNWNCHLHLVCICDTRGSSPALQAWQVRFVSISEIWSESSGASKPFSRCRIGAFGVHGRGNSARLPNLALAIRNGIGSFDGLPSKPNPLALETGQTLEVSTVIPSRPIPSTPNNIPSHILALRFATAGTEDRPSYPFPPFPLALMAEGKLAAFYSCNMSRLSNFTSSPVTVGCSRRVGTK